VNLTRREVIAATAGLSLNALAVGRGQKTMSKRPIVGSGEHQYEVFHDWLVPPKNLKWGDTHGVTTDAKGNIYIAHTVGSGSVSKDAICVFDQKGKFVKSFGSEFAGGGHGLDLRKEGREEFLYICDVNRKVVTKTDLNGKVVWEFGVPLESGKYPNGDGWNPTNVAFIPGGDIFVGDGYGSSYVHRFTIHGQYVSTIIGPGSGEGQVSCPHGLWVDNRTEGKHTLIVADRGNRRLQKFTLDGKHLGYLTEGIRLPCHIHFNHGLMLIPDLESVVTILDANDKPVAHLGDGHPSGLRGASRDRYIDGKFIHQARYFSCRMGSRWQNHPTQTTKLVSCV
jgi:hypothetical protein